MAIHSTNYSFAYQLHFDAILLIHIHPASLVSADKPNILWFYAIVFISILQHKQHNLFRRILIVEVCFTHRKEKHQNANENILVIPLM